MTTDEVGPDPAIAVSPTDQSSDREQSDANNAVAVDAAAQATTERADNQAATSGRLDDLTAESAERGAEQLVAADKLDQLIDASHRIIAVNTGLTASNNYRAAAMTQLQERARLAKRRYLVTLTIIVLGFSGLYIRQEVANNNAQSTRDQIVSCTTPAGKCYQDSQRQTVALIAQLIDGNLNIAACAPEAALLPPTATPAQRKATVARCVADLNRTHR